MTKKLNPEQTIEYSNQLEKELKARKSFPDDENGAGVHNRAEGLKDLYVLFVITIIVGFIGMGTHWQGL